MNQTIFALYFFLFPFLSMLFKQCYYHCSRDTDSITFLDRYFFSSVVITVNKIWHQSVKHTYIVGSIIIMRKITTSHGWVEAYSSDRLVTTVHILMTSVTWADRQHFQVVLSSLSTRYWHQSVGQINNLFCNSDPKINHIVIKPFITSPSSHLWSHQQLVFLKASACC